jgi:hypothetical protein
MSALVQHKMGKGWIANIPGGSQALVEHKPGEGWIAGIPGRFIEEGILRIPHRVSFVLRFQGFPSWILALDRTIVKRVTFVDWSLPSSLLQWVRKNSLSNTMLNAAIAHIRLGRVHYGDQVGPNAIWLLSGSLVYAAAHEGPSAGPLSSWWRIITQ